MNITDLDSWLRVATGDKDANPTKLDFLTDPAARSDPLQPRDFAIKASGTPPASPGSRPRPGRPAGQA